MSVIHLFHEACSGPCHQKWPLPLLNSCSSYLRISLDLTLFCRAYPHFPCLTVSSQGHAKSVYCALSEFTFMTVPHGQRPCYYSHLTHEELEALARKSCSFDPNHGAGSKRFNGPPRFNCPPIQKSSMLSTSRSKRWMGVCSLS